MSQGRASEVLTKSWQEMPGSGIQVRIVSESGLHLTDNIHPQALKVVTVLHHEIHEENVYETGSLFPSVADNATVELLIKPLGSTLHMDFFVSAGGDAEARLLENPTVGDSGTQITPFNKFRPSSNLTSSESWVNPTVTGEGTVLYPEFIPGGTRQQATGGSGGERDEFVLSNGSLYVARVTNKAGSAKIISINCTFYEAGA